MSPSITIGNTPASDSARDTPVAPFDLAELLQLVNRKYGSEDSMLNFVACQLLEYAGRTFKEMPIQMLEDEKEQFIMYLKAGKYKAASVNSYRNCLNRLLYHAKQAGWVRQEIALPPDWQTVADLMPPPIRKLIARFAVRLNKPPKAVSEDDLAAWCQERARSGRSLQNAERDCSRFRTAIVKNGLSALLPLVKPRDKCYGIPVDLMHADLRHEVEELLQWKQSEFQIDRLPAARIRPISARRLRYLLGQLTGFVQNVAHQPEITSLSDLVTRDNVRNFTTWARNTRKLKGQYLATGLGMVYAALRHNPRYKALNLSWFENIIGQLPMESQSAIDQRKAKKYIPYDEAEQIPIRIRAERMKLKTSNPRKIAINARNELLTLWLVILPWRQKNIRECRVVGSNPNLWKSTIKPFCTATKPSWIKQQESVASGGNYWQFHFSEDETKMKHEVQAFLPSELIPLLEEYLAIHRPVLVNVSCDPGTLFVSNTGLQMDQQQIGKLVKQLGLAYAGVPVTPHLYRDVVAYEWLRTHPEDFLTLSKLLWHRNINTTLRIYGHRFDESTGAARMDEWRISRTKKAA